MMTFWDVEILDPPRPRCLFWDDAGKRKNVGRVGSSIMGSNNFDPNGYDRCDRRLQKRVRTGTGIPS